MVYKNDMIWNDYNVLIQPLIKRFGSYKYTTEYISKHYFYWKDKDKSELLDLINQAVSFNQQLDLKPATNKETPLNNTKSYINSIDNLIITDGYLSTLLSTNDCKSLKELVEKKLLESKK